MDRNEACKILGLSNSASETEINAAFKELIRQSHPDINPQGRSDVINDLITARNTLISLRRQVEKSQINIEDSNQIDLAREMPPVTSDSDESFEKKCDKFINLRVNPLRKVEMVLAVLAVLSGFISMGIWTDAVKLDQFIGERPDPPATQQRLMMLMEQVRDVSQYYAGMSNIDIAELAEDKSIFGKL